MGLNCSCVDYFIKNSRYYSEYNNRSNKDNKSYSVVMEKN